MSKYLALIIKDFKIQFKSPFMLLFSLGFPLMYLFLFGFLEKSSTKQLKLWIDSNLASEFDNKDEMTSTYMEGPITINLKYLPKAELLDEFEKGKLPIIYYQDIDEKVIYLNINKSKSRIVYHILKNRFYPIKTKKYELKKKFSMNYALLTMVFNFLLLFSSINYGSSLLYMEIKKHNILILLKSGISKAELIASKIGSVFIIQILSFTIFYSVAILTNRLTFNLQMLLYLPFIIIPTSLVGIFISSVTANENVKSLLPMIFWFPSIFYSAIKDSISPTIDFILKLDPLILIVELIEQIIRNDVSNMLLLILSGMSAGLFILSVLCMKRTIIRSM